MKNKNLIILLLLLSAFAFLSCSQKTDQKNSKKIGVTLLARAHIFYRDLEDGLNAQADSNGYQLIVASADFDLGKQISQIEDFISRKVDAIIVCPVDSKGIGPAIEEANRANIPVFTADIAAEQGSVVSHIASDNVAGGRLAGEYLAKLLNGKGEVALIDQPAITSVLDRVNGFKGAISKYPGMKIVADVNGMGVRDRSLQAATDALQAHPNLSGIFGINDDSALGALDAVKQFNKKGISIIGYDATPPARKAILDGTALKADVVQYPENIGKTTIKQIKDYFEGKTVPKLVPVDVGIVDQQFLEKENQSASK
jgi:ribose transport system substrate-binding protein